MHDRFKNMKLDSSELEKVTGGHKPDDQVKCTDCGAWILWGEVERHKLTCKGPKPSQKDSLTTPGNRINVLSDYQ